MSEMTRERALALVEYNSETGVFTWRDRTGFRFGKRSDLIGRPAGCINKKGYRTISIDNRIWYGHRLAWLIMTGEPPPAQIDHINCDKADNRFCNLRSANDRENRANSPRQKNNTSGVKGVYLRRDTGKWCARIQRHGRIVWGGDFASLEEAATARASALPLYHGEFSRAS